MERASNGPIGVFDSGYGGLTVLKELVKTLPEYDYIYLGDNARAPYGGRSFDTVYDYTLQAVEYLFAQGCSLVILACNTASAKALRSIQQNDLPKLDSLKRVLGVLRPTTEIVGALTETGSVGVLATKGTVASESYPIEISKFYPQVNISQQACPMWVPLVENNEIGSEGSDFFVEKYLNELLKKDPSIDTVLLACTHFPLLENSIRKFLPRSFKVVAQGEIVADRLQDYLQRHPEMDALCSKKGSRRFYTTDASGEFDGHAEQFYGEAISSEHVHL